MNKRVRNLAIMCGVCVLAFGGYAISHQMQDKTSDADESEETSTDTIFGIDAGDITDISYTYNGNDEISLTYNEDWSYAPDDTFKLNETMAEDMAAAIAAGSSSQMIEAKDVDALAFGLEEPLLTISFTKKDGSTHTAAFGNFNTAISAYYAQIDSDENVYMVAADMVTPFQYGLYDLLTVDPIPSVEADYVSGFEVTYGGNTYTYTYSIETGETVSEKETTDSASETDETTDSSQEVVWYESVNGGIKEKCDSTEVATYVDYILGITSEGAVNYNAGSAENLAADYGIDRNYITVNYVNADTDEDVSYTLHFGSSDEEGNVYFTLGDSYMVQSVSGDTMAKIFK